MKTIKGIYTQQRIADDDFARNEQQYTFNTEENIKVGDMIQTNEYRNKIQVTEILSEVFVFLNTKTWQPINEASNNVLPIKVITIKQEENEENSKDSSI